MKDNWLNSKKKNVYIYFLFVNNDIQRHLYIGIGTGDFAYKHATGKLSFETMNKTQKDEYYQFIHDYRYQLKLDEIDSILSQGEEIEINIFRENLDGKLALQTLNLLNQFQFRFSRSLLFYKPKLEASFYNQLIKYNSKEKNQNTPNGYYNYLLFSKEVSFVLYRGVGIGEFAQKHALGDFDNSCYQKMFPDDEYEDGEIGYDFTDIEIVYLTTGLTLNEAVFFQNVLTDLYRLFCQDVMTNKLF